MPKSQPHTGMTLLQTAQAAVGHYEHALEMLSRVRARGTIENAVQDAARMTDLVDVTNSVLSAVDQLPVAMRSKLKRMSLHATYAAMDSRSAWRGHLAQAHHLADQVDTALSEFVVEHGRPGEPWDRLRGAETDYQAGVRDLRTALSYAGR